MRINSQSPSALNNQQSANPAQQAFHELKHMVMKLEKAISQMQSQQQGQAGATPGATDPNAAAATPAATDPNAASAQPQTPDLASLLQQIISGANQLQSGQNGQGGTSQLSADQQNQLQQLVGALQQAGVMPQTAATDPNAAATATGSATTPTGYPQNDSFQQQGVHHKHHHHHPKAPPPTDPSDPSATPSGS